MLHSVFPHTVVDATVDPHVCSKAFFLIVFILALVATAILPEVETVPVHFACPPLALVARLVYRVGQLASTVHQSVGKLAGVHVGVLKVPGAAWTFFPFLEVALIFCPICSGLDTISVLSIEEEASLVAVLEHSAGILSCHFSLPLGHTLVKHPLDRNA